jgi:hypothetical protein
VLKNTLIAAASLIALGATHASAQDISSARRSATAPVCPPTGISPTLFIISGGNDALLHPYEAMSPCLAPETKAAILAMGMGRLSPNSQKAVMSIAFSAKGTWIDAVAGPVAVDKLNFDAHFYFPATRVEIAGKNRTGKPFSNVEVYHDDRVWDETTPGVGPKKAPAKALDERMVWPKLLPFGALLSIVEAQGTAKVTKDADGKTVLTGKSPYEPFTVTLTLNAKSQVEAVTVPYAGHTYRAVFENYNDVSDNYDPKRNKWEPAVLVPWVDRLVWTKDGKPYADLTTTAFKSNAYMVFPYPELLKATADEADPLLGYDRNDKSDPRNDPENQFSPALMGTAAVGAMPGK